MILIDALLNADDLGRIGAHLAAGIFRDGRATAGGGARRVKHNEQLDPHCPAYVAVAELIGARIRSSTTFQAAALPKTVSPLIVGRYGAGMAFGSHYDNAVMAGSPPLRSDLAFTIFLSAPDTYEGGALILDTTAGEEAVKLEAGAAVLYPATSIHRVEEVKLGTRLVAVGWVQSLCRLAEQRDILFKLDWLRAELEGEGRPLLADRAGGVHANLLRLWAEL